MTSCSHIMSLHIHTHTPHTRLTALYPGPPRWAGTRKVKPIRILLKQETVSGSGISWAICKSAPRSRQITMPAPHHSAYTVYIYKSKGCPYSITECMVPELILVLGSQPAGDVSHKPVVSCHYFPPGLQLPSQPLRGLLLILLLGEHRHDGCEQFA